MILLLLSTILLLPVFMGAGKMMESFSGKIANGISGKILSGILGISVLWTVLSFFIPLNIYVELPTIAVGLAYFLRNSLYRAFSAF